jgi:pyruvate dehydrogenase E2 component (dihydrolipoamide acetyltransferase)
VPDVYMPRLSDSMDEGTIVRWLKDSGEDVRRGEEFVEIETDKATVAFEAEHDGVLQIVAPNESTCPVGQLIAYIGEPSNGQPATTAEAAPVDGELVSAPPAPEAASARAGSDEVSASPTARRLAESHGVDLKRIQGTGPQGRITRADVFAASSTVEDPSTREREDESGRSAPSGKGDVTRQELTRIQQTIARRMAESRATVPDFTLEMDVEMDSALDALERLRASDEARESRPTLNDLIVKACALALREFPIVNGSYRDGGFELYSRVNVGVAVATERALLVPTVIDADQKTVIEIARETRRLAREVRDETISPADLSNGTFTVSNLGMYGVRAFRAVINPPQTSILAVGATRPLPTVLDNSLTTRQVITLTLSCDHRILYGAEAAQFLARIADLLGNPREWCGGPGGRR